MHMRRLDRLPPPNISPHFTRILGSPDGVHVHPYAVAVAYETHPTGLILVTDAMAAMGLPPGRHMLGE